MPRTTTKKQTKSSKKKGFSILDEDDKEGGEEAEDLPKDEAGRRKIKRQYEDLLGIRIEKTVEGIYFICVSCRKVCHNLDEGLVEDPENQRNVCNPCSKKGGNGKEHKGRAA